MQSSNPPNGNSFSKSTSYDVQIVKTGPTAFCTAHPFLPPPPPKKILCFTMLFNRPDSQTPKSVRSRSLIYTPYNACSLDLPDSASQNTPRSVQPFLHSSRHRVPILYNVCLNKNSSGDDIANVNFYAVRPEAKRIR